MKYTRIYTGDDGETHFDDVTVDLTLVEFAPPAPPMHVSPPVPSKRMIFASLPMGWVGEWHPAPARQFALLLTGSLEVSVSDGAVRTLAAGESVLLEDTAGVGHRTRAVGETEVTLAFVQLA